MSDKRQVQAVLAGNESWGSYASAKEHERYSLPLPRSQKRPCGCGCDGVVTHMGMANGLALMSGCELSLRRWVRQAR